MGRIRTYDLPILERVYQTKANERANESSGSGVLTTAPPWSEANKTKPVYNGLTQKSARTSYLSKAPSNNLRAC